MFGGLHDAVDSTEADLSSIVSTGGYRSDRTESTLQDQLGLRLQPQKAQVTALVVEQVEMPSQH